MINKVAITFNPTETELEYISKQFFNNLPMIKGSAGVIDNQGYKSWKSNIESFIKDEEKNYLISVNPLTISRFCHSCVIVKNKNGIFSLKEYSNYIGLEDWPSDEAWIDFENNGEGFYPKITLTLTLSKQAWQVLRALSGNIVGCNEKSWRKFSSEAFSEIDRLVTDKVLYTQMFYNGYYTEAKPL